MLAVYSVMSGKSIDFYYILHARGEVESKLRSDGDHQLPRGIIGACDCTGCANIIPKSFSPCGRYMAIAEGTGM